MKPRKQQLLSLFSLKKSDNVFIQFFRYFGVTIACFSLDFIVLYSLTELLNVHYQLSTLAGYFSGMILNYFLSVSWVFNTRRLNNASVEFSLFAFIGIVGMFVNQGLMWVFTDFLGLYFMFSRMISAVIGYTWKFFARKYFLFHKKESRKTSN